MIEASDWSLENFVPGVSGVPLAPHVLVVAAPPAPPPHYTTTQVARMQVARPGHIAEREELDAALEAGTVDALLLFIDRHPKSRYRAEAENALRRLGLTPPPR